MKTIAHKCRVCVSSALCVVMLLGSLPITAMAQETPNDALPQAIDGDTARRELLLTALRGGQVSVEAARQGGDLSVDDVIEILATRLNDWGGFEWGKDEVGLRRALAKVLAEHGGERLKKENLGKLPPKVRLWLADYYQSIKDPRTVEVAEGILSEFKKPTPGTSPTVLGEDGLVFQTVERLAWYYRDMGQYQQAAETWLRMAGLHEKTGWWVPDSLIEAARLYAQMGDAKKAKELYTKVPQYGSGWFTGLALFDQAQQLISQEKHEEARKLLRQPVTGEYAERSQVALMTMLGVSYYWTGEFGAAQKYFATAVDQYKALTNPLRDDGLRGTVDRARQLLQWSERWKKEPIICEAQEIHIAIGQEKKPVTWRFAIRTYRPAVLAVTLKSTKAKAQIVDKGEEEKKRYYFEKDMIVEIAPEAVGSFDETLVVSSLHFPDFQVRVPVHVEVQQAAQQVSTRTLFGSAKAGETSLRTLKVSASVPFRILQIGIDNDALQVSFDKEKAITEHRVELSLTPNQSLKSYQGKIRIVTDLPFQGVTEMSYYYRPG